MGARLRLRERIGTALALAALLGLGQGTTASMAAAPANAYIVNVRTPLTWSYNNSQALSAALSASTPISDYNDVFAATCEVSQPGVIQVEFDGSRDGFVFGGFGTIANYPLTVHGLGGTASLQMIYSPMGSGPPPFRMQTAPSDPVWRVLAAGGPVTFASNGKTFSSLTIDGPRVQTLLAACNPSGSPTPAQPNVAATPSTSVQPTTTPAPSANAGNGNGNGNAAAAVALGALGVGAAIVAGKVANDLFTEAPPPNAPSGSQGRQVSVRVTNIKTDSTTFGFGADEIFLLASTGQRFPAGKNDAKSVNDGDTWSPGAIFSATGGVSIDLREYDSISASDLIGNFAVADNVRPGRYTTTLKGGGGVYEVTYEVSVAGVAAAPRSQPQSQPQPQVQTAPANMSNRMWGTHNSYQNITVTDCSNDCGDDIGIILMCQGGNLPARVEVPRVALESGSEGDIKSLSIVVGHQAYVFDATLGAPGMVGYVPSFTIAPNDPLLAALQSGSFAQIVFEGQRANIGLKGSRMALEIFKAHCWNSQPVAQTPAQQPPMQQAPVQQTPPEMPGLDSSAGQPLWFLTPFTDSTTGRRRVTLAFGVPETDGTSFSATCSLDGDNAMIPVDLNIDVQVNGNVLHRSTPVTAFIQTSSHTGQYGGQVFDDGNELSGVLIGIPLNDPIWQAIQNEQQGVILGIGGQPTLITAAGAAQAVPQFLAACAGGQSAATQPVQQTPTQQLPIQQMPTQQVPIQQQPGTLQLPAGGASSYLCDDGSALAVSLTSAGTFSVAAATYNGTVYNLVEVPGAVGKKYSNGVATLSVAGSVAQFAAPNVVRFCQAN